MDINILTNYSFLVVAAGTVILAIASGMVGTISVLKGQSLIGDAIGHSSFAGIVISFMLFQQRNPIILALGALFSGIIAFFSIQLIGKNSKIEMDSILALVLSSFFGLGMVLKSYIQGNPQYSNASQAGLQNYIFGQAAYLMRNDVYLIILAAIISISLLLLFYKEIKIFVFDEQFARSVGIKASFLNWLILIMSMVLISVGLKAVGAILISSMLIAPAITGLQWSNRFPIVLLIAGIVGGGSAFVGTYISSTVKNMPTGPMIILMMSIVAIFSILFSPKGFIAGSLRKRKGVK
ncbi:manganese/zinc/iron transport system permease [Enterococcus sp. DIV2402]|uniref:Manganese/zinc/iron transport system permease n=1 Tax=Candidatus Enterococcus lowellii TaxID=2230877 RepID=A0ABZ2SNT1_9ENTE|nr:iron chelate uptake ABC transporter family permease subunit [Enterococcus sp. DIV2402]MBO0463790.1 metal ABC transporter permease [Enterococcus sp. DIV2402]